MLEPPARNWRLNKSAQLHESSAMLVDRGKPTFPTSVEPVNDIFATRGCSHRTVPTAGVLPRDAVITFTTPGGMPACSAS